MASRPSALVRLALTVALGVSAAGRSASAGEGSYSGIAAATPDGRNFAVFGRGGCGLSKKPPAQKEPELLMTAICTDPSSGELLPFERWTWSRVTPEIRALQPITRAEAPTSAPARLAVDPVTEVRRLEISLRGTWYPVLADETSSVDETPPDARYGSPGLTTRGSYSEIRGFLRSGDRLLVTFSLTDAYELEIREDAVSLSDREISDVTGRFADARARAQERTSALRQQYATRSGAFAERPKAEKARKRRRADAAREALQRWEVTRVFGPLRAPELRDALWLLAWLEAPARRLEAMRFYLELRDRDAAAADAIARELAADPATAAFAAYLQTRNDPLRGLPAVTGCRLARLSDAAVAALTDEQLLWLHRAQWAAQGCYRFSAPKVQEYFEQFTWYAPIPKEAWRARLTKKLRGDPDGPLLKRPGSSIPADACRENLETILKAERARGLAPPPL